VNDPIHLFGPISTTPLELVSFVLALLTVWLNIRQKPLAWWFSIVSSATYAAVFYDAKLYGDMGLQFVFIAVSFWGWYQWVFGGDNHSELRVSRLGNQGLAASGVAWLATFGLLAWLLKTFTDTDVAHMDGFLTAGSLVGQLLLSRKKLENWHVWIAVDVLYVGMYVYKALWLTAVLYALFVVMAWMGLKAWKKTL
jgi:nicotinamide mononucleotide transporter